MNSGWERMLRLLRLARRLPVLAVLILAGVGFPAIVFAAAGTTATIPAASSGSISAGSIHYDVHFGSQGFKVGEAVHQWQLSEDAYELELQLKTTGLVGLFGLEYKQLSRGKVLAGALQPQYFAVEQRGRKPERAEFDWAAGQVALYRAERLRRTEAISTGDQDVLSLWHEARRLAAAHLAARQGKAGSAAAAAAATAALPLRVITGRKLKLASLSVVGEEGLKLPAGEFDTLQLRVRAEDGGLEIELWLSQQHQLLPVRIRLTDEDGQVLDQRATAISIQPALPAVAANGNK